MDENNYTPNNGRPVELSGSTFSGIFRAIGGSLILRGVIMIIFGVLLWINPFKTLDILIKIIGIMLIIDAVPLIVSTFRLKGDGRTVTIIPAAIMLILGLLCIFNALGIARLGTVIIGIWQLISGIQSISTAKSSGVLGIVSALLTILVGVILIVSPLVGLLAYTWLLAFCIIVSGVSTLLLGTKLCRS